MIITMYSEESTRHPEEEIVSYIFMRTDIGQCVSLPEQTGVKKKEMKTIGILASQELERCL